MTGWIAMPRAWMETPELKSPEFCRLAAWAWMVEKACWKPTPFDVNGRTITLQPGQFCTSRHQLANAWGWSPSAVERFLTRLKTGQLIEQETGQGRSVITICNYNTYQRPASETGQATERQTGQQPDSDRTAKEQGNKGTRSLLEDSPHVSTLGVRAAAKRGTRLAPDWQPKPLPDDFDPPATPGLIERELSRFRDYWAATPGTKGVKLDWDATWRNWLRRSTETPHGNGMARNDRAGAGQYRRDPAWDGLQQLRAEFERDG